MVSVERFCLLLLNTELIFAGKGKRLRNTWWKIYPGICADHLETAKLKPGCGLTLQGVKKGSGNASAPCKGTDVPGHLLGWMLKASLVRGVMGGGLSWELGAPGDTENRRSLDITFSTWLLGLCGLRGLIWGTKAGRGMQRNQCQSWSCHGLMLSRMRAVLTASAGDSQLQVLPSCSGVPS